VTSDSEVEGSKRRITNRDINCVTQKGLESHRLEWCLGNCVASETTSPSDTERRRVEAFLVVEEEPSAAAWHNDANTPTRRRKRRGPVERIIMFCDHES
jgi:hypothetical protein